ncbi:MAG: (Fe-S)-binding protein [Cyanobacteria bacterium K_DeepCast_35m_m2_023]|nr:(Fe-S)-binding protein [Cyanobacteria bacterium K_DeepCast_35m_m2_023]
MTTATDPCVHCGFCLPSCASYLALGSEMDSPRGRIHALKAIEAGELALDATVAAHFDSCLGCLACVSACPSGVRYDQLIEATRPKLNAPELRSPVQQLWRRLLFGLLPYPGRLRPLLRPLRAYAGTPLQTLVRGMGLTRVLGPQLTAMEQLLPPLSVDAFADTLPQVVPAQGERRYRVGLLLGCVQRVFDPAVNQATAAVLAANGIEVVIPREQGCCGAVTHHQGVEAQTRELAAALIRSFAAAGPLDAVLVSASGCGHSLKAYGRLLAGEPALADAAAQLAERAFDVQEFLAKVGLSQSFCDGLKPLGHADGSPATADNPLQLAYHDACHMLHGQGISAAPRELLRAIPHVRLREPLEQGVCCGSAGIYNLVQPAEAAVLGERKAADLEATGATLAVSANIGCTLQLKRHLGDAMPVLHPMQLLAQSFGR